MGQNEKPESGVPAEGIRPPVLEEPLKPKWQDLLAEKPESARPVGEEIKVEDLESVISNPFSTQHIIPQEGEIVPDIRVTEEGVIQFNANSLDQAEIEVILYMGSLIERGDPEAIEELENHFLWYLRDSDDQAPAQFAADLKAAVQAKSTTGIETLKFIEEVRQAVKDGRTKELKLKELSVVLPTRSMAERQMMKREIKSQIPNLPFNFKDVDGAFQSPDGTKLNFDPDKLDDPNSEVEFVLVKEGRGYKLIISSSKGIGSVTPLMDEEMGPSNFIPIGDKVVSDRKEQVITIPVKDAADGTEPLFKTVEIRKKPIKSLVKSLSEQEEKMEEEDYQPQAPSVQSLPPRSVRPTSYVTISTPTSH